MSNGRFAVVLEEVGMLALTGEPGFVGVCIVDGEEAETQILRGRAGLAKLLGDIPTCPSGVGRIDIVLPLDDEREALDHIRLAASQMSRLRVDAELPAGVLEIAPRYAGGVQIKMSDYGLDIRFSVTRAKLLGLHEGSRLRLGLSSCGTSLIVLPSLTGPLLSQSMEDPEYLITDSEFAHLPLYVSFSEGDWQDVEFNQVHGGISFPLASIHPAPRPFHVSGPMERPLPRPFKRSGTVLMTATAICVVATCLFLAFFL